MKSRKSVSNFFFFLYVCPVVTFIEDHLCSILYLPKTSGINLCGSILGCIFCSTDLFAYSFTNIILSQSL